MKKYTQRIMLSVVIALISLSATSFASIPISRAIEQDMIKQGTYQKNCPVPPKRLTEVRFKYYDFAGIEHDDGQIIVLDAVTSHVERIFEELHQIKFHHAQFSPQ